jgi:hypothetical protein
VHSLIKLGKMKNVIVLVLFAFAISASAISSPKPANVGSYRVCSDVAEQTLLKAKTEYKDASLIEGYSGYRLAIPGLSNEQARQKLINWGYKPRNCD